MRNANAMALPSPWIRSKRWDLGWLVLSVLVVPLAPLLFQSGMTANEVATIVMLLAGGPHVFVTFTRTNLDPKFVRGHRLYASLVFLIPLLTAAFAFWNKALFLTVFFAWASLHVLQQIAYVANCYSNRQTFAPTTAEKTFEYGLVFSCLYPFATVRMVEGTFALDGVTLLVPDAFLGPWLVRLAFGVFGFFLCGWLYYGWRRFRAGSMHYGKTGLIGATVAATLFTPLFHNLDVAFQGINTWHCVQYLALIWLANRRRSERGELEAPFVRSLSAGGWQGFMRYWGTGMAATALLIGVIYGVKWVFGFTDLLLVYYMIGKGLLLSHYYYDTFLFTQKDELTAPATVTVAA
jgi:hypothetical protein